MIFTNAKNPDNPVIFANDSFLKLTGYEREEVLAQSFTSLMAKEIDENVLAEIAAVFDGTANNDLEICCRRKDGSLFWAAIYINPVRDEKGEIVEHFTSFVDVTQHRQQQAQQKMLIDELNHRVKNTLATVQAIVAQAFRKPFDPKTIKDAIEGRIYALSRSHDLLTQENWTGADLRDLIVSALEPFGVKNGRAERFLITGENIHVPPKVTLTLGIALHELATNAVKYGAFSNEEGSILIQWHIESGVDGDKVVLSWTEQDGPSVEMPTRKGFGSQFIERGLAHELEAVVKLDYRREGFVCRIDIPIPKTALNE